MLVDKKMTRIITPIERDEGLHSPLAGHFGRAPLFALIDLNEDGSLKQFEAVPNTSNHFGGTQSPPDFIQSLSPDLLVVQGMGGGAINRINELGIQVAKGTSSTIEGLIHSYLQGKLTEDPAPCKDRHNNHQ